MELVNPAKLKSLAYNDPIKRHNSLDIYENPIEDHNYLITVDVARGIGNDYSAFVIFDITQFPYRIVGKYRNNELNQCFIPASLKMLRKHIMELTY